MFDQHHDLTYDLIRERLADRKRVRGRHLRTPAGANSRLSAHAESARQRLANRLGDVLIQIGARLKRQDPCPEQAKELAWLDRK